VRKAILPGFTQQLEKFQKEAQDNKIGIYMDCDFCSNKTT
jgi:hypothetical protein